MEKGLVQRLETAANAVFRDSPVLAAYAYGSRVSGRPRPNSDLDLGYYLTEGREGRTLSLREELRLASALAEAIGIGGVLLQWYNFARIHQTLRVTPAMEAGISEHVWSAEEIARLAE